MLALSARVLLTSRFAVKSIVRPGETLSSTRFERRAGGKGANQAVAVAQAGAHVVLIGAIGSDGDWILKNLNAFGVDIRKVVFTAEVSCIGSCSDS